MLVHMVASSSFLINSQMGILTSIAIGVALIFDFTLLPALLMIGHKKGKTDETPEA